MFKIEEDIRKARTLPSEFYTDERNFEMAAVKLFSRSWQFLGRADDFAKAQPHMLLPGLLDEPLVTVKNGEGSLICRSNVCTHRGMILVEEACEPDILRCRYHGRRFSPEGKCLSMPEFEEVEGFPSPEDDLAEVPCGDWNGFVFASASPAAPLLEFVEPIAGRLEGFAFEELEFTGKRDYEVDAHWALYCENYLEGFHIPYVHPSLNRELDYSSYSTELFRYSSLQTGRSGNAGEAGASPLGGDIEALYYFVFPNLMLNFYHWGISVNIVRPLAPGRSVVTYLTYVSDPGKKEEGAGADLDAVELEDQRVVESVQKGIRSRYYDRGRYSPSKETGTHHFHRLICEFLAG